MTPTAAPRLTWRRPWYGVPLGLVLALLLAGLRWHDPAAVERVRLQQFDLFQQLSPRATDGATVWIVDVDEESLRALGQWPWPRWRLAALVEKLQQGGIAALGIDMVFDQPDRLSPPLYAAQAEQLPAGVREALASLPPTDQQFATALAKGPVSMAALGIDFRLEGVEVRAPRTIVRQVGGQPSLALGHFEAAIRSLALLTASAAGEGIASATPEPDNIVRRVPVVARVGTALMPSLGFDTLRLALGARNVSVVFSEEGRVRGAMAGELVVPTTGEGRLWLHFTPHRPERFVSAADIIEGRFDPARLGDQVVLLGSTALGLGDFHASPINPRMPGVEIQAQAIENMIDASYLKRWERSQVWEALVVLLVGSLVVALPYRRPTVVGAAVLLGAVLLVGVSFGLFVFDRLLVDITAPIAGSLVIIGQMLVAQLRTTDQERRRIASALAREREMAARIEGELTAARQIQMGMLPQTFPHVAGFEIAARIEPAKAVGGDFYDIRLLDDGRVYFAIGDVSGKGVPAALFMALAQSLSRASARQSLDIGAIVTETNRELSAENPAMMFVTLIAGLLDPASGEFVFANAGHDAPIRIDAGGTLEALEGDGGPPLCVVDDFEYPSVAASLAPGQTLVLFTDGVTEATAVDEALYGMERLRRVLGEAASADAGRVTAAIVEDVALFARGAEPADDVTVLVLRRVPVNAL